MATEIHRYSHFFKILPSSGTVLKVCRDFTMTLVQWTIQQQAGKTIQVPYKVFAASDKDRKEFRFHITLLNQFLYQLGVAGISSDSIEIIDHQFRPSSDVHVDIKIKPGWSPMEHQVPILEYLDKQKVTANNLITLYTGGGKSYTSMQFAANQGMRCLYLIRPAFMDKWEQDIMSTLDIDPEDVISVRGSSQLMALLATPNTGGKLPKVILMSNKTYQSYLKLYEQLGSEILDIGYDCLPEEMYEHLSIGIRFIDEVHLDFHLNFKADLYTNIPRAIAMSASLINQSPFLMRMYNVAYPEQDRYKSPPPKKYIEARALHYKLEEFRRPIYTWRGRKEYSHGAFEEWILKNDEMTERYLDMLKDVIDNSYILDYKAGDRLLVFCYSIKMASVMTEYLSAVYPDKTVERYVEDDEYRNVMEPDIRVSTVLSAGTGIDIKKLKVAVLTTAISSEQSNIQALGRLRELKDDDRPPIFYYYVCDSIPKQVEYHERKKELLKNRVISVGDYHYDYKI